MKFVEYYGSPSVSPRTNYEAKHGIVNVVGSSQVNLAQFSFWTRLKLWLTAVFLPQGYPESVSEDYLAYQIWDTIQAFCSSITRTLATYAVLKGSGVGDVTATALSATMSWIMKDGCGMISRISFAYVYGSSLDANSKQWRFFADVLNDCAILVELLAPFASKEYFTYIMCLSGVAYSIVGVAGGCTRAALTLHQAKRNNMADVSAKDGSQETLVNLAGLVASLVITPLCSNDQYLTWILFTIFTCGHLFSNYQAVRVVVMDTFNRDRFYVVMEDYMKSVNSGHLRVLTPAQANAREPIFFRHWVTNWMNLGCSFEQIGFDPIYESGLTKGEDVKFLMALNQETGKVDVAIEENADSMDLITACFRSFLLYYRISDEKYDEGDFFDALLSAGWSFEFHQLCPEEYRWKCNSSEEKYD